MKLEQQVVSLELAKKLKELGVKQYESHFQWVIDEFPKKGMSYISNTGDEIEPGNDRVDAFTVAELGEMLPLELETVSIIKTGYEDGKWQWEYKLHGFFGHTQTEADARAKMLIYLLENNLIKNA